VASLRGQTASNGKETGEQEEFKRFGTISEVIHSLQVISHTVTFSCAWFILLLLFLFLLPDNLKKGILIHRPEPRLVDELLLNPLRRRGLLLGSFQVQGPGKYLETSLHSAFLLLSFWKSERKKRRIESTDPPERSEDRRHSNASQRAWIHVGVTEPRPLHERSTFFLFLLSFSTPNEWKGE